MNNTKETQLVSFENEIADVIDALGSDFLNIDDVDFSEEWLSAILSEEEHSQSFRQTY